jgi:hypothetical protein
MSFELSLIIPVIIFCLVLLLEMKERSKRRMNRAQDLSLALQRDHRRASGSSFCVIPAISLGPELSQTLYTQTQVYWSLDSFGLGSQSPCALAHLQIQAEK